MVNSKFLLPSLYRERYTAFSDIAVLRCWYYVHHFHEFIRAANLCSDLCYCITTQFVTAQLLWL